MWVFSAKLNFFYIDFPLCGSFVPLTQKFDEASTQTFSVSSAVFIHAFQHFSCWFNFLFLEKREENFVTLARDLKDVQQWTWRESGKVSFFLLKTFKHVFQTQREKLMSLNFQRNILRSNFFFRRNVDMRKYLSSLTLLRGESWHSKLKLLMNFWNWKRLIESF